MAESPRQRRLDAIAELHAVLRDNLQLLPGGGRSAVNAHNLQNVVAAAANLAHQRQHGGKWAFGLAMRRDIIHRAVRWLLIDLDIQDASIADNLPEIAATTDAIVSQMCGGCAAERRAAKRRRSLLRLFCC